MRAKRLRLIPFAATFLAVACSGGPAAMPAPEPSLFRPAPADREIDDYSRAAVSGMTIAPGQTVTGELSEDDYLLTADGSHLQVWELEGQSTGPVTVDLRSNDFDSYLLVFGRDIELSDDDGAGFCDSRITFSAEEGETYRLVVNTLAPGETGAFRISASGVPGPVDDRICDVHDDAPTVADIILSAETETQSLAPGAEVGGALTRADAITQNGGLIDVWELRAESQEHVAIELSSTDFDTYLWLVGDGLELQNDDGGGNCNSLIVASLAAGSYRIGVTTFNPDESGAYNLRIANEPGEEVPGGCQSAEDSRSTIAAAIEATAPDATRMLEPGSDVRGNLSLDDAAGEFSNIQVWTLRGEAEREVTVELISTDFDAYLWASGPELSLSDDDGAGNCNASISLRIPRSGEVNLGVSSFDQAGTGEFRIRVLDGPGPTEAGGCDGGGGASLGEGAACAEILGDLAPAGTLEAETVVRSELTSNDARCSTGAFLQVWELDGARGERLTVDVFSSEFDTFMYLLGPGLDLPLTNDDGGGACNSRIEIEFPRSGTYRVGASSYNPGRTGSFSIRMTETPPPPRNGSCPAEEASVSGDNPWSASNLAMLPPAGTLRRGSTIEGFLTDDDVRGSDGRLRQAYTLMGEPGELLRVHVESEDFDTFLAATGPGMPSVETDDDGGEGTNSSLNLEIPEDGRVMVVVSSFSAGEAGLFTLSVEARERK